MNYKSAKLFYVSFSFVLLFSANIYSQTWQLIWSDEFNETSLDLSSWTREIGGGGWGNNELQYYTDRTVNSYLENGSLVIKAMLENYGGNLYTSARLKTQGKRFFKYGKIEARMKLPFGQGIWPAFWMLGESISSLGWPACGEIDIMEMLGHENDKIYGTAHWESDSQHALYGGYYTLSSGTFSDDYHLFTITWDMQNIMWYVDNIHYFTISITPDDLSELHEDQFILLNLAVGGNWPGYPDSTTIFPQYLYVDYVRVYKDTSANFPTVDIISPTNNYNFSPGSDINISVEVSNFSNPIQYVEFYQGDARIGIDSQAPYSFNWQGIYEGAYTLKAKAKDNTGLIVTSNPINITVGQGYTHSPYLGRPVLLPGVVEMENYDLGGQGIAYNDSDPLVNQGNQYGNLYRTDEGVDLQSTTDIGGGANLGWTANGEWLNYFINVSQEGYYRITSRVASPYSSGVFNIEIDGFDKTGNINVPLTGDWQNWTDVIIENIYLEAGVHIMKFRIINSGFNVNKIIFSFLTTDVDEKSNNIDEFKLYNNYPNPFNPSTKIKFSVLSNSHIKDYNQVTLKIFDSLGNLVSTLINEGLPAGAYEVDFNASGLSSGVYFYQLISDQFIDTKEMLLLK